MEAEAISVVCQVALPTLGAEIDVDVALNEVASRQKSFREENVWQEMCASSILTWPLTHAMYVDAGLNEAASDWLGYVF